jgi:hypothetical protein
MKLYSVGLGVDLPVVPARKFKDVHGFMEMLQHPDHIDLGFTLMTMDYTVNFNQSRLFNSTDFTGIIYNPFAGLVYTQKTTAYFISLNQIFLF